VTTEVSAASAFLTDPTSMGLAQANLPIGAHWVILKVTPISLELEPDSESRVS
jgi:hypothetical protein